MTSTYQTSEPRANAGPETLADVLSRAPVALTVGLHWATTVAGLLQDMHQRDCRHGKVSPANVLMGQGGLQLVQPAQSFWKECSADRDVRGFGEMLFEIVTGTRAPEESTETPIPTPAAGDDGLGAIRSAAVRLALKCLGHLPAKPNMRQAAMEVRLLWLQARRIEARESHKTPATKTPAATPFLVELAEAVEAETAESRWMRVAAAEVA